ncbi:MAG: hypothetical protein ACLFPE_03390 [Bacteroidales bacterium]
MLLISCREENFEPGIPAFLQMDTIGLSTDYGTQGSDSHNITDVWVFANGATVGVFEMPVTFPVLLDGEANLRLEAGIKLNGISTSRINNPFFEPVVIDNFNFIPDSIIHLNPTVEYRESVEFPWIEDFEDPSVSLDTSNLRGDADIHRSGPQQAFEGSHSGIIQLGGELLTFEAATFEAYTLPVDGSPVMLEMNYKNDIPFVVGIFEQTPMEILKKEIMYLNPSEDWNKIYINFTNHVLESNPGTVFKVFYRAGVSEDDSGTIYLDNIKLMYR